MESISETIEINQNVSDVNQLIEKLNPYDTLVFSGIQVYTDSLFIGKPLTVIGRRQASIIGNARNHIVIVKSDDVSIIGMNISNSGISYVQDRSGVKVDSSSNFLFEGNTVENCMFALHASASDSLTIRGNKITGEAEREASSGNGIHLWYCKNVTISDNIIKHQRDGIYFEFVSEISVHNNYSANNLRYGLHFMFSHNAEYAGNIFENNGSGVAVMYTKNIKMHDNIFKLNQGSASYGILLKDISKSEIRNNTFLNNTTGIFLDGGGDILFEQNDFKSNGWALKINANTENNTFTQNNFIGNTFDVSTNSSSSSNTFYRNFWDKYTGYDLNRDGIGDVRYHPVRLFSYLIVNNPSFLILLHSFFINLLDLAENLIPTLTPESVFDSQPLLEPAS